ncbi:MAG: class I SAM-dependent methyltransferase [Actinomycetia bacterium]|nr:class I SAM-dependent methyltransferase [Actinomycetes bacterium]
MSAGAWDSHADWWAENFSDGADPEYAEQILPLVEAHIGDAAVVVDIGCGEGQVSRAAAGRGCTTVGLDPAAGQLATAVAKGGGAGYVRASAAALPLADGCADVAVACLVLEHVGDLAAAIDEAGRVLRLGGHLLVVLNHPIVQTPGSGWVDDHIIDPPEQYWQLGWYLDERSVTEQVDGGVFIEFHHRPLSRYVNAAAAAGMLLEHMEEPAPPPGFVARAPEYVEQVRMPRVMFLSFVRA